MKLRSKVPSRLGIAALAVGSLMVLASCAAGQPADDGKLVVWDYYQPGEYPDSYVADLDEFGDEHDIEVERVSFNYDDFLSKVLQAAASNTLPDVLLVDNPWNSSLAVEGVVADITDRTSDSNVLDGLFEGPRSSIEWDDRVYGVPYNSNALVLFYSKSALADAGVEAPSDWDELAAAAAATTNSERFGLSLSMASGENSVFVFQTFLWQAGADMDSLDSPEAAQAMTYIADLVDSGSVSSEALSWNLRDASDQLANGRAAMVYGGTWDYGWLADAMGDDLGIALLPAGPAGGASNLGGENWTISSTTSQGDLGWEFIEFMSEPERQLAFLTATANVPPSATLASDAAFAEEPLATFVAQMEVVRARAYGPQYPRMAEALSAAYQSVLSGQDDVDTAFKRAASEVDALLSSQ